MTDKVRNTLLTKDTVIRTNIITIISVISAVLIAATSYTVAISSINNNKDNISNLNGRVQKLEQDSVANREILIEIRTDVGNIKERLAQ